MSRRSKKWKRSRRRRWNTLMAEEEEVDGGV